MQSRLQLMFTMLRLEIERHKRLESRKRGADVGWDDAERDWLRTQFPRWKRRHWNHALSKSLGSGVAGVSRN